MPKCPRSYSKVKIYNPKTKYDINYKEININFELFGQIEVCINFQHLLDNIMHTWLHQESYYYKQNK